MALSQNQETTMAAMAEAFRARMEELFPLPEEMSESDKEKIRANWEKLGQAVAAILAPTMTHITGNAEIGTVTSDVVGALATQNNTGGKPRHSTSSHVHAAVRPRRIISDTEVAYGVDVPEAKLTGLWREQPGDLHDFRRLVVDFRFTEQSGLHIFMVLGVGGAKDDCGQRARPVGLWNLGGGGQEIPPRSADVRVGGPGDDLRHDEPRTDSSAPCSSAGSNFDADTSDARDCRTRGPDKRWSERLRMVTAHVDCNVCRASGG